MKENEISSEGSLTLVNRIMSLYHTCIYGAIAHLLVYGVVNYAPQILTTVQL